MVKLTSTKAEDEKRYSTSTAVLIFSRFIIEGADSYHEVNLRSMSII